MVSAQLYILLGLLQFKRTYFGAWDAIVNYLMDEDTTVAVQLNTLWTARRRG